MSMIQVFTEDSVVPGENYLYKDDENAATPGGFPAIVLRRQKV